MKPSSHRHLAVVLLLAACGAAQAAGTPDDAEARQREQIQQGRSAAEKTFLAEQEVCYRKFAVNDCLSDAKKSRRRTLGELQRQELALNEAKRQREGAARLEEIERRQSPEKLQQRQDKIRQSEDATQRRQERAADKATPAARAASAAGRKEPAKGSQRVRTAADQQEAQEAYQRKLDDAKKRRESLDRRKADRKKPPASSLPAPR